MAGQPGRMVIVGAGPAGMALGYLLSRRGVGVTVLEMHQDFARSFRCEGVQRSGIDAFRQMGLGEPFDRLRSEEYTSELQSLRHLVCRLLLEKKNKKKVNAALRRVAVARSRWLHLEE